MKKVKVLVIAGCLALTFASPAGAKPLKVSPIEDRQKHIENDGSQIEKNWTPIEDGYTPIED